MLRHEQKTMKERTEKLLARGRLTDRQKKQHKETLSNLKEIETKEKKK